MHRMMEKCWNTGEYKKAFGVATEAHRKDLVDSTLRRAWAAGVQVVVSNPVASQTSRQGSEEKATSVDFLVYAFEIAYTMVSNKEWRNEIFRVLAAVYADIPIVSSQGERSRDVLAQCRVLQALEAAEEVATVLVDLLKIGSGKESNVDVVTNPAQWYNSPFVLSAFQIAIDAYDVENGSFLVRLYNSLPMPPSMMEGSATVEAESSTSTSTSSVSADSAFNDALTRLRSIVDGSVPSSIVLDFMSAHRNTDPLVLKKLKTLTDNRNTVLHHAAIISHAFMNSGTSQDGFIRSNITWLSRAENWSRFSAVAATGVIHKGNTASAMRVLKSHLPSQTNRMNAENYEGGGALFALGLINANRGIQACAGIHSNPEAVTSSSSAPATDSSQQVGSIDYLLKALADNNAEEVKHGACLGLGLVAMGTGNEKAYSALRSVVLDDRANSGEAAGIAQGLLLLGQKLEWVDQGTGNVAINEMLASARETQHEKITRGLTMGIALACYGKEEFADALIKEMLDDKDAAIRYGGVYAMGMAYAGTGNCHALRTLLHVAVSDVADDVRRGATSNIGFVLARQAEELPSVIASLAESYNPHVRYGAAMALGVACAGTGMSEAIGLLEPLLSDSVDFVRQGALIALGLVLQGENDAHLPRVKVIRERMWSMIEARTESTMSKMGALLGLGLLEMGGRNVAVSMISRSGFQNPASVVGLAVFLQYWSWFPLLNFISLAAKPTFMLGLTGELMIPEGKAFPLYCGAPQSWFDYPPFLEEKKEDKASKLKTIELSTAAKARAKAKQKDRAKAAEAGKMEVEAEHEAGAAATTASPKATGETASIAAGATAAPEGEKTESKEASGFYLSNPCRVTVAQTKFVAFGSQDSAFGSSRYVPVKSVCGY